MSNNRTQYYKQYEQFYRDHKSLGKGNCFYCGRAEEHTDHVPALSWTCSESLPETTRFFRVASCGECNLKLGGRPLHTVQERQLFLLDRYYKEFNKIPEFSAEDFDDLGHNLFSLRARTALRRAELGEILRWARKNLRN